MREIAELNPRDVAPGRVGVLRDQGVPKGSASPRIERLLDDALAIYHELARPVYLIEEIDPVEFLAVLTGEGDNEPEAVVELIAPEADAIALYAATLGQKLCNRISGLFGENEPALASMLDAVASRAADLASGVASARFRQHYESDGHPRAGSAVLPYSPGYCGWHISGQRKLFDRLRPDEIGITLNKSFLMAPLKSVSGALIAGTAGIHIFDDTFAYCAACATHSCRERIAEIASKHADSRRV